MRYFMELKRCKFDCGLYPLSITIKDQNFGRSNNGEISFERDTSIVRMGVEGRTETTCNVTSDTYIKFHSFLFQKHKKCINILLSINSIFFL